MNQIYNDNPKRPKPKENQLGILEISSKEFMHSVRNSAEGLGSRSLRIHPKVAPSHPSKLLYFPLKVTVTLLGNSGKGTVGS